MQTMQFDKRKSGISLIDGLSWGSHFCLFYQSREDLLDILVPYFRAGLENNEFCLWVVSEPLSELDAENAIRKSLPDSDRHAERGQMKIIHYNQWRSRGEDRGEALVSQLDKAISRGFDGVRISVSLPSKKEERIFASFDSAAGKHNVLAAFAYPRDNFDAIGLMEVVKNHRLALLRNAGSWEVVESREAQIVRDALKSSDEKLQSIFNNMSEGFSFNKIVMDSKGKPCDFIFLGVNEAFERLTGLNAKDIINRKATEVLPGIEKEQANWILKFGKVAVKGKPAAFESYSEIFKKWYSVSAFTHQKGFFSVTFSDITEHKHFEEKLKDANEELEGRVENLHNSRAALLNVTEDIIKIKESLQESEKRLNKTEEIAHLGSWELDLINNKLSWSDEVYRIFGLKPQEFGASYEAFLDMIYPDDREAVDAAYSKSLHEGKDSYEIEHRIVRKSDGQIRFVHEKCEHVKDESGRIIRSVGMVNDITERKKADEEILMLNENLKQRAFELDAANKELEAFSYSASHDLRAPLRSIDGFGRLLEEEYGSVLDKKGKQFLERLRNAAQKMGRLIDDLLDLSKVTRAGMQLKRVDLSAIAGEIASKLREAEPERNVEFAISENIVAKCDKSLIHAVLENLLGNAWKFTSRKEKARIEFGATLKNGERAYFVKDNGSGFDMGYSDKLFTPFQRLHTAAEFKGTGIGLSIVQRIINRHGGKIWAESEVEKGATFYFTLA